MCNPSATVKEAYVAEIEDWSSLNPEQFWAKMRDRGKMWSYDDKVSLSPTISSHADHQTDPPGRSPRPFDATTANNDHLQLYRVHIAGPGAEPGGFCGSPPTLPFRCSLGGGGQVGVRLGVKMQAYFRAF